MIIVLDELAEEPFKMLLAERNDVVEKLAPERPDEPLDEWILPRAMDGRRHFLDSELGLTIVRRVTLLGDGIASPVIVAKNEAWTLQLGLRNMIEELLFVDREEVPVRVDRELRDQYHAQAKLWNVARARLKIIRALLESESSEQFHEKLAEQADSFAWIRVIEDEGTGT